QRRRCARHRRRVLRHRDRPPRTLPRRGFRPGGAGPAGRGLRGPLRPSAAAPDRLGPDRSRRREADGTDRTRLRAHTRLGAARGRRPGRIGHDCGRAPRWAGRGAATGLEFLHRRDGRWYRPVIERRGDTVTVETETAAGDPAVRMLLAAVLTQALKTGTRR